MTELNIQIKSLSETLHKEISPAPEPWSKLKTQANDKFTDDDGNTHYILGSSSDKLQIAAKKGDEYIWGSFTKKDLFYHLDKMEDVVVFSFTAIPVAAFIAVGSATLNPLLAVGAGTLALLAALFTKEKLTNLYNKVKHAITKTEHYNAECLESYNNFNYEIIINNKHKEMNNMEEGMKRLGLKESIELDKFEEGITDDAKEVWKKIKSNISEAQKDSQGITHYFLYNSAKKADAGVKIGDKMFWGPKSAEEDLKALAKAESGFYYTFATGFPIMGAVQATLYGASSLAAVGMVGLGAIFAAAGIFGLSKVAEVAAEVIKDRKKTGKKENIKMRKFNKEKFNNEIKVLSESLHRKEGKAKVIPSMGKYKVIQDDEVIATYIAKYEAEDHVRDLNDRWAIEKDKKKEAIKIDGNAKKSQSEWISIFKSWSNEMDKLYKGKDRHDATMWDKSPADWMSPYNDDVFQAWSDNDAGGSPSGGNLLKKISKESIATALSEKDLGDLAVKNNISPIKFVDFWTLRFPNNGDMQYANEWAKRLAMGTAFGAADSKTKVALEKAGFKDANKD